MSDDFTKVRMIHDKDYAHYRSHTCSKCGNECNKDRAEINDALNEKYSGSILSDEPSTTEHPAELNSTELEQDEVNHAGVPPEQFSPPGTHDEANSFVDDNQDLSNNAERVISNQQELSASLDEVSNSGNNVDVAKNVQQVFPKSTAVSAANMTPPPSPAVIALKYNCTSAAKSSPGKPVSNSNVPPYLPYKCSFCSKTYSTPSSVRRHVREKHPNSTASTAQQHTMPLTPVVPQPTGQPAVPQLIAVDGTSLSEMKANASSHLSLSDDNEVPLPPDDDDFDFAEPIRVKSKIKSRRGKKKSGIELAPENVIGKERSMRKRKINDFVDSDEEEEEETPEKYNKIGRGGNFYSSWD